MKTLIAVGGPVDGQWLNVPDHAIGVANESWAGVYQRVEVLAFRTAAKPPVDRWAPQRRTAQFGVVRKPFGG